MKTYKATYIVKEEDLIDIIDMVIEDEYDSTGEITKNDRGYYEMEIKTDNLKKFVDDTKDTIGAIKTLWEAHKIIGVAR